MIGQQIESRPGFPWGALFFALIAAGLGLGSVLAGNFQLAIGAVVPLCISGALFLARQPTFSGQFTDTGLEVSQPRGFIPYTSLQGLWGKGRSSDPTRPGPRSFMMRVVHDEGVLHIPPRLNVPSDDVYLFLYDQFPPEGARGVSPPLRDYLAAQEVNFGKERVFAYRARDHLDVGGTYVRARAVALSFVPASIAWVILGAVFGFKDFGVYLAFGILFVLFGLLFFVVFLSYANREGGYVNNWRQASLVISPVGLGLVQGDVTGEMRWDELRDVQLHSRNASFTTNAQRGRPRIILKFEGADVTILDIYDQPLRIIYERIRAYWK